MPILDLQFTNAGPFEDMMFEFDEHVNVFVGPNNCGKSTALTILGATVRISVKVQLSTFAPRAGSRNVYTHGQIGALLAMTAII